MDYVIQIKEQSGKDLTDYQVKVEITDPEFFQKCTDQKYVEFYDEGQQTLLNHWTELFDISNNMAIFWVKVPSIPANSTKTIYLNINTERTEDLSNGEATFDFFDDFEGSELDTNKWEYGGTAGTWRLEVSNSILELYSDNGAVWVKSIQSFDYPIVVRTKVMDLSTFDSANKTRNRYISSVVNQNPFGSDCGVFDDPDHPDIQLFWQGSYTGIKANTDIWQISEETFIPSQLFRWKRPEWDKQGSTSLTSIQLQYGVGNYGETGTCGHMKFDFIAVRKYTEPEPSVTVIKIGATPTYELKLKIAKALAGETDTILDTDPKIRLLSGSNIIKELSLTAKTVYKDATNSRVVVAFLFVDDSSDSYTTDNQELLFTKDNTEYVAFKSNKTFTKESDKKLPLRWEIYLPYDIDVCTYEESMIGCL